MNDINPQLQLADNFVRFTGINIFLTGKAGTGKTTFLRRLKADSPKRMIVVAPTGVAAINAGGVTIHSFFQLPFAPFVPDSLYAGDDKKISNQFGREKRNILSSLDLLVIDEISMVRADLLDAIDNTLRRYKNRTKPFGGVQLLMIGDLQQLAPVVRDEEWAMLRNYYKSPYFFHSKALRESYFITIELDKIYRQSDPTFVSILNKIRENRLDQHTLDILNKRYKPGFNPSEEDGYITLTTHNTQASVINQQKLDELTERPVTYKAKIEGNFPPYSFPTDEALVLKKGAQVMFLKNDPSPEKRYYNGKIGHIISLSQMAVVVKCDDNQQITVEPQEWTNAKYVLNEESKEITESIDGKFTQIPLKTAWAITIHKSQGLTFDRAIINAGAAFTHGQVYVALSRCRSIEGLVLSAPISQEVVISDQTVDDFNRQMEDNKPDSEVLDRAKMNYFITLLSELFDYRELSAKMQYLTRLLDEHLSKLYPDLVKRYRQTIILMEESIVQVGMRFQLQVHNILSASDSSDYENDKILKERTIKASNYFKEKIITILQPLLASTNPEIDNKEIKKQVDRQIALVREIVKIKMATLDSCSNGFSVKGYMNAKSVASIEQTDKTARKAAAATAPGKIKKEEISADILNPELYERLRQWRKNEAEEKNLPVYTILQQKALIGITNKLPTTKKDLLKITGIGKIVVEHYGEKLIEIVNDFKIDNGLSIL